MRRGSLPPAAVAAPAAAEAATAARSGPMASPTEEALRSRLPGVAPAQTSRCQLCAACLSGATVSVASVAANTDRSARHARSEDNMPVVRARRGRSIRACLRHLHCAPCRAW